MSSPKVPSPEKTNYERDIKSFVKGVKGSLPDVLGAEGKYRGKFTNLNLADAQSLLQGRGGQMGLAALGGKMNKVAGRQLGAARKQELGQMTDQTGLTRGLLQSMSPESAAMVAQANQQATAAQQAAQGLTGQEARSAEQFARESSSDRGRVMDNSSMASELLNRDSILGAKRQEANMATQNAYNLSNSFYSQPGLQALSSVPNSMRQGQSYLGSGLAAIGQGKPQLIDIGAGLNLGAANGQNKMAADQANAQLKAQQNQAYMQTAQSGLMAYAAYAASAASDERLKQNIKRVGTTDGGFPIYTFQYKSDPGKTVMGVMAQDVEKILPEAVVTTPDGFKAVYYDQIN